MKVLLLSITLILNSSSIFSNDTLLIYKIYELSIKKNISFDTVLMVYNGLYKKFRLNEVYQKELKLTEEEIKEMSYCITENLFNSKEYKNRQFENTDADDIFKITNNCYKFYIEKINLRSGIITEPNFLIKKSEEYKQYDYLINTNGWSKELIYSIYGNCVNNLGRMNDFISVGYTKRNYFEYCDCLVKNIIKKIKIEILGDTQTYKSMIESIGKNCVSNLK